MFSIIAHAYGQAASTTGTTGTASSSASLLSTIVPFALILGLMYLFIVAPQRKKDKEAKKLRDSLMVGDEVVSVGGIVGKILKVKDDEITLETGSDKNRLVLKRWAVNTVAKKTDVPTYDDDDADAYLDEYVEDGDAKTKKKKK